MRNRYKIGLEHWNELEVKLGVLNLYDFNRQSLMIFILCYFNVNSLVEVKHLKLKHISIVFSHTRSY